MSPVRSPEWLARAEEIGAMRDQLGMILRKAGCSIERLSDELDWITEKLLDLDVPGTYDGTLLHQPPPGGWADGTVIERSATFATYVKAVARAYAPQVRRRSMLYALRNVELTEDSFEHKSPSAEDEVLRTIEEAEAMAERHDALAKAVEEGDRSVAVARGWQARRDARRDALRARAIQRAYTAAAQAAAEGASPAEVKQAAREASNVGYLALRRMGRDKLLSLAR